MDKNNIPRHVALVMDGNGRWATKRGLPRTAGHAAGAETFRRVATHCKNIGMNYFTVYAFSTENWKRPETEVSAIMKLLENYLREATEKMLAEGIKLKILGDTTPLSPKILKLISETEEMSKRIDGTFQANLCINYGGRDELVHAMKKCIERANNGEEITEKMISESIYTADIPDPELIIRTGGELRLSNFLMWQSAYSELYFTDRLWPDFTDEDMDRAIEAFQGRKRRFGGI